jgi:hypothetical protein
MRRTKWLAITGGVVVALAIGWVLVAIPALVKFPTNIDTTVHYTGTFTTMVDAKTMLPLAQPQKVPMAVDREIKVVGHTASTVTVTEDVTTRIGTQAPQFQHMQYVMNRKTMEFVDSPETVAFSQSAGIGNPAGTYRVNFPMGTSSGGSYPSWTNETGSAVVLSNGSALHLHQDSGIKVVDFKWNTEGAVTPAYLDWLKANGNPTQITPTQMLAILNADGINVTQALNDVRPRLTPAEAATVQQVLQQPVKLNYRFFSAGTVSIEPKTGAEIFAHADTEGIKVSPDLSGASQLLPLLSKYSSIPSVKALADGLTKLAAQPPQVAAQYQYAQTPVSSAELGRDTRNQLRQMNLVEFRIPWGLGLLGLLLLLGGIGPALVRRFRTNPPAEPAGDPVPVPPEAPLEPVLAGSGAESGAELVST